MRREPFVQGSGAFCLDRLQVLFFMNSTRLLRGRIRFPWENLESSFIPNTNNHQGLLRVWHYIRENETRDLTNYDFYLESFKEELGNLRLLGASKNIQRSAFYYHELLKKLDVWYSRQSSVEATTLPFLLSYFQSLNVFLNNLIKGKEFRAANLLIEDMLKKRYIETYVEYYRPRRHKYPKHLTFLSEEIEKTYTKIYKMCRLNNDVPLFFSHWQRMVTANMTPTKKLYYQILLIQSNQTRYQDALECYRLAVASIDPQTPIHCELLSFLIRTLSDHSQFDLIDRYYQAFLPSIPLHAQDRHGLTLLLHALMASAFHAQDFPKSLTYWKLMHQYGIKPKYRIHTQMLAIIGDTIPQDAGPWFEAMKVYVDKNPEHAELYEKAFNTYLRLYK